MLFVRIFNDTTNLNELISELKLLADSGVEDIDVKVQELDGDPMENIAIEMHPVA